MLHCTTLYYVTLRYITSYHGHFTLHYVRHSLTIPAHIIDYMYGQSTEYLLNLLFALKFTHKHICLEATCHILHSASEVPQRSFNRESVDVRNVCVMLKVELIKWRYHWWMIHITQTKNYMLMYTAASTDVHSETQRVQMNECREVEHSVGLRLKC